MPAVPIELKVMLSAKEVGKLIGKSGKTVRRYALLGNKGFPPPAVRIGHPRWKRLAIEKWLSEQ
jgi:predicted DNA-binding transcriptional regulator AlpA